MRIDRFLLILLLLSFHIYSYARSTGEKTLITADSIKEIIVYEYDTVYVAPDTIRKIDTIYQLIPVKKNLFQWSAGAGVSISFPGITGNFGTIDSFSVKNYSTYSTDINFSGTVNHNVYFFRFGLLSAQKRLESRNSAATIRGDVATVYDSLSVTNTCKANISYRYVNFSLGYGKRWGKGKVFYGASILGNLSLLFDKQNFNIGPNPEKSLFRFEIGPFIGFRARRFMDFHLKPFYVFPVKGNYLNDKNIAGLSTIIFINF